MAVGIRASLPGPAYRGCSYRPVSLRYPMPPAHWWPLSPDDTVVTRLAAEPVRERDASQAVGDQQSYDHQRHRGDARWKPPAASPRRSLQRVLEAWRRKSPVPIRYVPADARLSACELVSGRREPRSDDPFAHGFPGLRWRLALAPTHPGPPPGRPADSLITPRPPEGGADCMPRCSLSNGLQPPASRWPRPG